MKLEHINHEPKPAANDRRHDGRRWREGAQLPVVDSWRMPGGVGPSVNETARHRLVHRGGDGILDREVARGDVGRHRRELAAHRAGYRSWPHPRRDVRIQRAFVGWPLANVPDPAWDVLV